MASRSILGVEGDSRALRGKVLLAAGDTGEREEVVRTTQDLRGSGRA